MEHLIRQKFYWIMPNFMFKISSKNSGLTDIPEDINEEGKLFPLFIRDTDIYY